MAFNKKKKRRITVDNQLFFWSATGSDGYIHLMVMTECEGSGKLSASFDYHQERSEPSGPFNAVTLGNQFVITPFIVRQVIQLASQEGWKPLEKGADVQLGSLDDKIDLRLDRNRANCFKQAA